MNKDKKILIDLISHIAIDTILLHIKENGIPNNKEARDIGLIIGTSMAMRLGYGESWFTHKEYHDVLRQLMNNVKSLLEKKSDFFGDENENIKKIISLGIEKNCTIPFSSVANNDNSKSYEEYKDINIKKLWGLLDPVKRKKENFSSSILNMASIANRSILFMCKKDLDIEEAQRIGKIVGTFMMVDMKYGKSWNIDESKFEIAIDKITLLIKNSVTASMRIINKMDDDIIKSTYNIKSVVYDAYEAFTSRMEEMMNDEIKKKEKISTNIGSPW